MFRHQKLRQTVATAQTTLQRQPAASSILPCFHPSTLPFVFLLACAGCLQVDLNIALHNEDGGATVTERLRISEPLRQLSRNAPAGRSILHHLKRDAALERMKRMGKGITLVSHQEADLEDGSRESVALYRIPDFEDLRFPNPFVQDRRPHPMVRIHLRPCYKDHRSGRVGTLGGGFARVKSDFKPTDTAEEPIPAVTPLDRQLLRDLQPIFTDLAKGFHVRVSLTAPNQPAGGRRSAGPVTHTLLSLNDKHLDRYAEPFFQNEEAMLALLQLKLDHKAIIKHTNEFFRKNHQVPVHRGRSQYGSRGFRIRPTTYLFKKYFAGRPKSEGGDR
jgi:hypothetical protein